MTPHEHIWIFVEFSQTKLALFLIRRIKCNDTHESFSSALQLISISHIINNFNNFNFLTTFNSDLTCCLHCQLIKIRPFLNCNQNGHNQRENIIQQFNPSANKKESKNVIQRSFNKTKILKIGIYDMSAYCRSYRFQRIGLLHFPKTKETPTDLVMIRIMIGRNNNMKRVKWR